VSTRAPSTHSAPGMSGVAPEMPPDGDQQPPITGASTPRTQPEDGHRSPERGRDRLSERGSPGGSAVVGVCRLTPVLGPVLGPDHVRDVIGEALRRVEQPHQASDRELVA
jgi:hypothetical protein